jgi:hypothetical protein
MQVAARMGIVRCAAAISAAAFDATRTLPTFSEPFISAPPRHTLNLTLQPIYLGLQFQFSRLNVRGEREGHDEHNLIFVKVKS